MRFLSSFLFVAWTASALAQTTDSPWIYGIHWYGNTSSSDVESMTGGKGIWDLEITLLDSSATDAWNLPSWVGPNICAPVSAKGHSFVARIQPNWSRNVPNATYDPYTLTDYANDAKSAAITLAPYVHIWQVGNEVNIDGENMRWGGTAYDTTWEPTPAQYADCYIALRDKIHEATASTSPSKEIVLMEPNSPGTVISGVRFMDSDEYLWRMIDAVPDKSKIDGFALHGYSDPATAGTDYGMEGFWDSITEQISIIDQFGLGDRHIFITEFNKHMPDAANANVAAKFVQAAYARMNAWNTGTGDMWTGQPNHDVIGATWFVYPSGMGWDEYSLQYWKTQIASTDPNLNPWYGFQAACANNYASGNSGTGPLVLPNAKWWEDDFNGAAGTQPDTTTPVPDWKTENANGGTTTLSGSGALRLRGNSIAFGIASIRTSGYAYGNFRLETDIQIVNGAPASGNTSDESNFDLRIREGTLGYSLTFFTSASGAHPGHVILRRTNAWTTIGSHDQAIAGGVNNGDRFHLSVIANGSSLHYVITKNGATTPVVNWNVTDSGQVAGTIRLMTYNMQEAQVDDVQLGGPQWNPYAEARGWMIYQ